MEKETFPVTLIFSFTVFTEKFHRSPGECDDQIGSAPPLIILAVSLILMLLF